MLRKRLIEALERGRERRLALIHAPAGFGKTTLGLQWRDHLVADGRAVAWMSIDTGDNEPIWFLTHLIEAIRAVRPTTADILTELLELHPDDATRYVLPALVNEVDGSGRTLVVMVDDWHRVTDPRTVAALEFLLDHASPLLQLVVLSRSRTGLPLGRLQVRHQVVEVDAAALRFDSAEAERLLSTLNAAPPSEEDLADLMLTTEGWVTALQLASLSLRTDPGMPELIKNLSGQPGSIEGYLTDNVLDQLPAATLEFLLRTALPDRLCADLVSTLTGKTHGQAWLEQIEAQDLFLRPVDPDRTWFRYHHLFAASLRQRLQRDHPDEVTDLHRRAAVWFAAHDLISEAVDHALAADAVELAADIVEDQAMTLFERSRMATLLALVDRLPAATVAERPRLQTALGWTNVLLQKPSQALEAAARVAQIAAASGAVTDQLLEARLLRSCIDVYQDRLTGVSEVTRECLRQADSARPWLVSAAADMQTIVSYRQFDFTAVRHLQTWTRPFHERTAGAMAGVYGQCIDALAALEQLDVEAAQRVLDSAHDWAIRSSGPNSYVDQMVSGQIAALRCELGDLAGAEAAAGHAVEIGGIGMTEFLHTSHVATARIMARRGDPDAARRQLAQGSKVARDLHLIRLSGCIFEEEARLGLEASEPLPTALGPRPDWVAACVDENILRARIFRALATDRTDVRPLLPEAHRLLQHTESQNRPLAALRARILLAALLHRAGRSDEARKRLAPALDACTRTGLVGPLTDGGAPVAELLRTMAGRHPAPRLSEREQQILKLLDAGRSNQEIAESLALTTNTVKWYLKTLYQKLDVTRRQECVSVARSLNLMP